MKRFSITFSTEEEAKDFALNFKGDEDFEGTTNYEDFEGNEALVCFKDEFADEAEMFIHGYSNFRGFHIVKIEQY